MRATLILATLIAFCTSQAQTVLFNETFDGTPAFTLNTADQGGATSSPDNTWLINNAYGGGAGTVVCLGFPFGFTVPATPAQPGGITNANGNYMHITSVAAQNSGVFSCCFLAADGLCANAASHFARMSTDVATGSSNITLSFWWICAGGASNYGEVYYSTNSGSSWNLITTPISQYRNQSSWVQQSISLPAFSNQATLRFGFRFVNGTTVSAADPAFAIDDVRITADVAVPNTIATDALASTSYCQGVQLSVPYTAAGTFTAGNVFTAELSDANGSFAAPTAIGSLSSTTSGAITCTIPVAASVGSGYRIRVVSSAPPTTGSDNGVNITITSAPVAGPDGNVALCKNTGVYDLLNYMTGASTCGTWTAPGGAPFSGLLNTASDQGGVYTYTTNCPGGCPQDQATLTVALINPANAGNDVSTALCASGSTPVLLSFVNGGDPTGIFFYNGQAATGALLTAPGQYDISYVVYGTAPCVNDTAEMSFTVNAPANAGSSTSVTLCSNAPPATLISLLGGTPDTNGTWTGPVGQLVSGVIDPAVGPPGLYTYTVAGAPPCVQAQAFVAIVIDPCQSVGEIASNIAARWFGQDGLDHLIVLERAARRFEVIDSQGRVAHAWSGLLTPGLQRIDLSMLGSGAYVLRVHGDAGTVALRMQHQAR